MARTRFCSGLDLPKSAHARLRPRSGRSRSFSRRPYKRSYRCVHLGPAAEASLSPASRAPGLLCIDASKQLAPEVRAAAIFGALSRSPIVGRCCGIVPFCRSCRGPAAERRSSPRRAAHRFCLRYFCQSASGAPVVVPPSASPQTAALSSSRRPWLRAASYRPLPPLSYKAEACDRAADPPPPPRPATGHGQTLTASPAPPFRISR